MEGITQTRAAEIEGTYAVKIGRMVKLGLIRTFQDGSIDPASLPSITGQQVPAGTYDGRSPRPDGRGKTSEERVVVLDLTKERARKEHYQAEKLRLEYEALLGNLLDRKDVEDAVFAAFLQVREELQRLAARLAGDLHAARTQTEVYQLLHTVCLEILESLADRIAEYAADLATG